MQTALAMGATVWCSACGPTSVPGFPEEEGLSHEASAAPEQSVIHPAETRGDGHDAYGDIVARSL